jgi:hypothetical protein
MFKPKRWTAALGACAVLTTGCGTSDVGTGHCATRLTDGGLLDPGGDGIAVVCTDCNESMYRDAPECQAPDGGDIDAGDLGDDAGVDGGP